MTGIEKLTQDVVLAVDILNLDEVVVTGSSVATERKSLGNAINTVSASEIEHTGSENPLAALSGRVLGAQITQNQGNAGGGFSVRLRGASTISGSSEPLYIVDGVIVNNSSQNVINLNADAQGTNFEAGQNRMILSALRSSMVRRRLPFMDPGLPMESCRFLPKEGQQVLQK